MNKHSVAALGVALASVAFLGAATVTRLTGFAFEAYGNPKVIAATAAMPFFVETMSAPQAFKTLYSVHETRVSEISKGMEGTVPVCDPRVACTPSFVRGDVIDRSRKGDKQ